jgi:hypothetical protein
LKAGRALGYPRDWLIGARQFDNSIDEVLETDQAIGNTAASDDGGTQTIYQIAREGMVYG